MSLKMSGKIIAVMEKRSGQNERGTWAIQEYVLETQEQYPHRLLFEAWGEDKIHEFGIKIGDDVTVDFDVNAREYKGRWYNSFRAWQVSHNDIQVSFTGDGNPFANLPKGSDEIPPF